MTQPVSTDIRVGSVLRDTYEITSLLGKGGMGAVFLARHRRLKGKQVAVKVLLNSSSLNPELYARFQREAEIASQLGHPNIVEVSDFDTLADGTPFLVMEYLRGESLEQRLDRGPLPLAEALGLTRQIGSALQAAHRAGVVHRDLKPANVFLVPTDSGGVVGERVKLLDFGISKMLDSQTLQTQDSVLIGTPQYMAPEQALGKNSEINARTDLFALGCIVYEMLAGRPPFAAEAGSSIVQVIFRIVHMQPEPLASLCPDVPAAVTEAVHRALSKTPDERFPDVAAFIAALTGTPLRSLAGMELPASLAARNRAEASGTARFAATGEDGLGLDATHVPSSTARFATPPADGLGLDATHVPVSAALDATHVPASTARLSLGPTPAPAPAPVSVPTSVPTSVPEAAPSAPPGTPSRRPHDPRKRLLGAALMVLAIGGVWAWQGHRSPPPPAPVAPVAPVAQVEPTAPTRADPPVEPPTPTVVAAPEPVTPPKVPEAVPFSGSTPRTPPRRPVDETIPPAALKLLREAEIALKAGDSQEAISLARRSQSESVTAESFSVLVRANCLRGDLGQALAKWREGRTLLRPAQRHQVKQFCKKSQIQMP